jgi:hypothetical protein
MDCQRCGQREATISTFVVDAGTAEYWELCETCCEFLTAENEAAGPTALRRIPPEPYDRWRSTSACSHRVGACGSRPVSGTTEPAAT